MRYLLAVVVSVLAMGCSEAEKMPETDRLDGDYTLSETSEVVTLETNKLLKDMSEILEMVEAGESLDRRTRDFLENYGFVINGLFVTTDVNSEEARNIANRAVIAELSEGTYQVATLSIRKGKFSYSAQTGSSSEVPRICEINEVGVYEGLVCPREGFDNLSGIIEETATGVKVSLNGYLSTEYVRD